MGDVVNLNKARKARAKTDARTTAEANRAKFGRSKGEKQRDALDKTRADKIVDGAKLDRD